MEKNELINKIKTILQNTDFLLYAYVRGSTLYNLNNNTSDLDIGGVYMANAHEYLGIRDFYAEQRNDNKNDVVLYEVEKYCKLLIKGNPTVLESLFIPEQFIIYKHPLFDKILQYKNELLTKKSVNTFIHYATSQIVKARGLNKKIVNPIVERKTPLDFTFTFLNQGSQPILNWLDKYGLKPEYCGLNKIPHMNDMYGLYYDWGHHFADHPEDKEKLTSAHEILAEDRIRRIGFIEQEPILHYRGLTTEEIAHTTQLRLSSIDDKNDRPICHISYNVDGFSDHCRRYKEYKEWEKERNPARYESNLDKNYDSKNMMHCFRLIHMGKEISQGKSMIIKRTWDHDFLMDIRNHKYEYDELINLLDKEKKEMDEFMKLSKIPDEVDQATLNDILFKLRMEHIKEQI